MVFLKIQRYEDMVVLFQGPPGPPGAPGPAGGPGMKVNSYGTWQDLKRFGDCAVIPSVSTRGMMESLVFLEPWGRRYVPPEVRFPWMSPGW